MTLGFIRVYKDCMTNYTGVIIEESLQKTAILERIKILKTEVEPVTLEHNTPHLTQWTMHTVEVLEDQSEEIAQIISQLLDRYHNWYADFKNDAFHYVIFRGKVFKVNRHKPEEYKQVNSYGTSLGIPDYQLDFSPDIQEWQR